MQKYLKLYLIILIVVFISLISNCSRNIDRETANPKNSSSRKDISGKNNKPVKIKDSPFKTRESSAKTRESSFISRDKSSENKVKLTNKQRLLLEGARSRLGDEYDASYYSEGHPPDGKSACVDVLYYAYGKIGVNLQKKVNADLRSNPGIYPAKGDYAINHRRCPNLIVWYRRYAKSFDKKTYDKSLSKWKPGDVVFWSLTNDGVADHCGIISDKKNDEGVPLVIHQFPPECKEEDVLNDWVIMGHFRW